MLPRPPALKTAQPDRREVLEQGVRFNPVRWKQLLPDPAFWPTRLDTCPESSRGRLVVTRATVFEICRDMPDELAATQGFVAACVWGAGTGAQSIHRRVKIFTANPGEVGTRLARALAIQQSDGAVAAYGALQGPLKLKYLGPAFFTKILYFAGYDTPRDLRPLILDKFVAIGLQAGWPWAGWSSAQYSEYLHHAHEWADKDPDAVELLLFKAGKNI
jgi:hypothetical protein